MPATRLLILPSAGWPIDFNRNLNAFKLGLMVQKFVQIGAKVRAALQFCCVAVISILKKFTALPCWGQGFMRTIAPPLGSVRICYLGQLRRNTRGVCVCFADKLKKGRLKIFQTALAICGLIKPYAP